MQLEEESKSEVLEDLMDAKEQQDAINFSRAEINTSDCIDSTPKPLLSIIAIKAPEFSEEINYYKEYWRTYLQNEQLLEVLQGVQSECLDLQKKINAIQVKETIGLLLGIL